MPPPVNRRLLIFVAVFFIVCAAGLGYTYSLAPTYVASARIQVEPGSNPDKPQDGTVFVANEAQTLTSTETLERVLQAISTKPAFWKFGSVPVLREVLSATTSPGTNVIELQGRGSDRGELTGLLDVWATVYLESRGTRRTVDRGLTTEDARKAAESIEERVARKRRELDEFRRQNSIVSPEREENEVAAEMKSLTRALNDARTRAIDAESRLSAAKAGVADGKPVYRAEDKAVIAQLEQRALEIRQKLKNMELNFTPQYLAMEPSVKAMHANILQLEKQMDDTRRNSQQAMLNEAAQDVLTAQKNVTRLEAQFGLRRNDALKFTSRFSEHKAQGVELAQLEAQLAQQKQRVALLERGERAREPRYELLGRPTVPDKPAHPDHVLYAAYSIGGALAAALLAVILVEFLIPRPKTEPAFAQPIIQIAYPGFSGLPGRELPGLASGVAALPTSPHALPAPPGIALRELTVGEVHALWRAATSNGRLAIAAPFSGLTLHELAALKWDEVDFQARSIKLPSHRTHPLTEPLASELLQKSSENIGDEAVAVMSAGARLSVADLAGLVAAAAHDAGIEQAAMIDADTLRHTYISFLVRQGARLSELEDIVGPVPPASFLHYRNLSPRGPGAPLTEVNRLYPAFASPELNHSAL